MITEKQVEAELKKEVESMGGICYKFMSPGRNNVPDRLCVLPYGVLFFIECKGTKGRLRSGQTRELVRLKNLGHNAYMIDSHEKVQVVSVLMRREVFDARGLTDVQ